MFYIDIQYIYKFRGDTMQKWPEHSVYAYLMRLPTEKLELIWEAQYAPGSNTALIPEDYAFIEKLLRSRPDSKLYED